MNFIRRASVIMAAGAVALGLAACDDGGGTGPGDDDVVVINMTSGLAFSPAEVTIAPGTTVRWVNDASIFHTITPDGHDEWARATVSTSGETFEHTFDNEGTFPYFCEPHEAQGMTGTIIVDPNASSTGDDGSDGGNDGYGY